MTSTRAASLTVGDVVAALSAHYPASWAESWDAVGLAVGDPSAAVDTVLLAVDPVRPVIDQAHLLGAQLVVTHHPLLLSGSTHLPRTDPKGAIVHDLVVRGTALFNAHTNADVAPGGVNDALAGVLGLLDARPLHPAPLDPLDQLTVFVPAGGGAHLIDALAAAGAGRLGDYERAAFVSDGTGMFRPLPGADPAIGTVGSTEVVAETRVEMVVPRAARRAVVAALRAAHPYEEPAFAVIEQVAEPGPRGLGRIGRLAGPTTLTEFVDRVGRLLPVTSWGVRAAGDPGRLVETVAVCGGSGAADVDVARAAGADVFLTSDLKHHVTSEATTERGPGAMALVDAAHWATEWPWLPVLATQLRTWFGDRLAVHVSALVTDPWTLHRSGTPIQYPTDS